MKKKIEVAAIMIFALLVTVSVRAQAVASADVSVQTIDVVDNGTDLTSKITVHNINDDTARQVTAIVLLPYQTQVLYTSPGCTSVPNPSNYPGSVQAYVECSLGDIDVGKTKTFKVITSLPPNNLPKRFAAFVWNTLPDPVPTNNFAEATAP